VATEETEGKVKLFDDSGAPLEDIFGGEVVVPAFVPYRAYVATCVEKNEEPLNISEWANSQVVEK